MKIEEFLKQAKPLDLVFFRGKGTYSEIISFFEWVNFKQQYSWTHVGIIVNKKIMPSLNVNDDKLYIYEAAYNGKSKDQLSTVKDIETNLEIFGVQIRDLEAVVKYYLQDGQRVGFAPLTSSIYDKSVTESQEHYESRFKHIQKTMDSIHRKFYQSQYTLNPFSLIGSLYNWVFYHNPFPKDHIFCSMFVCYILQKLTIIPSTIEPTRITPEELALPSVSDQFHNCHVSQFCSLPIELSL